MKNKNKDKDSNNIISFPTVNRSIPEGPGFDLKIFYHTLVPEVNEMEAASGE